MSAIKNIERQLSIQKKTLAQLEEQKAGLGLYAPPFIITGIENTKAAIAEQENTLADLRQNGEPTLTSAGRVGKKHHAEIRLQGNFSSVSADTTQAAINAFAAIMGISPNDIELKSIAPGSVILNLEIPADGMETLRMRLRANSAQLRLLGIERLTLALPSGAIESWIFLDGKFQVTAPSAVPPPPPKSPSFLRKLWRFVKTIIGIAVIGGIGIWFGVNIFAPKAPPPKIITATPSRIQMPPTEQPTQPNRSQGTIEIWLTNGCGTRYGAGADTGIFLRADTAGAVDIQLDGEQIDVANVAAEQESSLSWQLPQDAGEHLLTAVMENGVAAECPFFTVAAAAPATSISLEPDTDRPGGDYNAITLTNNPNPSRCQELCTRDSECLAFTFIKVGYRSEIAAFCYLKSYAPPAIGDDCCVSGVKTTQ